MSYLQHTHFLSLEDSESHSEHKDHLDPWGPLVGIIEAGTVRCMAHFVEPFRRDVCGFEFPY
jgi:hypothetical protein